jgi:hypothetical protein
MLALLPDSTIVEQCAVIQFLWLEWVNPPRFTEECWHKRNTTVLHKGKVYQLLKRFQSGRTNVNDEDCLSPPTPSRMPDNAE